MRRLPSEAVRAPRRWTAAEMWARPGWRISAPDVTEDVNTLREWATDQADPVDALEVQDMPLPQIRALAHRIRRELAEGSGVGWVRGVDVTEPLALQLLFIALGLFMGRPVGAYGRLYDVKDTGRSYITEAIPVSQTRASTGVHTDSSNKGMCPRFVALLCIRQAAVGGDSRIASALQAHEQLRRDHPAALDLLYEDHIRDLVTPGAIRNADTIRANAFPIFSASPGPAFRYMRFWIERGHVEAGQPLPPERLAALDLLDAALAHPDNAVRFRLEAGHMLFCDNTIIAHDRDAYELEPDTPRWLCRLWIDPDEP